MIFLQPDRLIPLITMPTNAQCTKRFLKKKMYCRNITEFINKKINHEIIKRNTFLEAMRLAIMQRWGDMKSLSRMISEAIRVKATNWRTL